jgi:hypothetical protein
MKNWSFVALLLVGATILGATLLREPIAHAAQSVSTIIIDPLDANGNVKVHQQATAAVRSANQAVSVTTSFFDVFPAGTTLRFYGAVDGLALIDCRYDVSLGGHLQPSS